MRWSCDEYGMSWQRNHLENNSENGLLPLTGHRWHDTWRINTSINHKSIKMQSSYFYTKSEKTEIYLSWALISILLNVSNAHFQHDGIVASPETSCISLSSSGFKHMPGFFKFINYIDARPFLMLDRLLETLRPFRSINRSIMQRINTFACIKIRDDEISS